MTPYWMRHGTCEDGLRQPTVHARPGSPLSVRGHHEARTAAARLRDLDFEPNLVAPSPLLRARQTATLIAQVLMAPLAAAEAAFAEWRAPDCVLGRACVDYPDAYWAWRQTRTERPGAALPGGESLHEFADRAASAHRLAQQLGSDADLVLIVSHRMLIGAVAAVEAGARQPADIFEAACTFDLAPCQLWIHTQGST